MGYDSAAYLFEALLLLHFANGGKEDMPQIPDLRPKSREDEAQGYNANCDRYDPARQPMRSRELHAHNIPKPPSEKFWFRNGKEKAKIEKYWLMPSSIVDAIRDTGGGGTESRHRN